MSQAAALGWGEKPGLRAKLTGATHANRIYAQLEKALPLLSGLSRPLEVGPYADSKDGDLENLRRAVFPKPPKGLKETAIFPI